MKNFIAVLLVLCMLASLLAACTGNTGNTTENTGNSQSTENTEQTEGTQATDATDSTEATDATDSTDATDGSDDDYNCITIAQAIELCQQTGETETSDKYYIRGTVTSVTNDMYGNMYIEDATGSILIYGTYSSDGSLRFDALDQQPSVGDEVVLWGVLVNYKSNTPEMKNAWLMEHVVNEAPPVDTTLPEAGSTLTIAEALALPLQSGDITDGRYYITATVDSITNANYGAMILSDETGSISVYGSYSADGAIPYTDMAEKPYKGDTVTIYGTIQNYNGTIEVKNAWIISFEAAESTYDPSEYTEMSIHDARLSAEGDKVLVTGVVARITFANGYIPSGFILVDDTSSIYVYDGELAARVNVGNTITIAASKTWWILDTELNNAAKFDYQGCNQLENATLVSNDNGKTSFCTDWVEETTVKAIMDTPVSQDITSRIYKVTALVTKAVGTGFVNYYIDDLDGTTGTYVYTQCSGGDFDWMDEYDGKICTVYLVALNAKSTASDCFWRFLPIAIYDDHFDVSTVNVAEHVVKYYGVGQFLPEYSGDPALELITTVDSSLLNFTGASLSYTSSDTSVVKIEGNVMHCVGGGTADITVTGTYGGKTYSETVTITVTANENVSYISVADAIGAASGETVTVHGIVGPSLVNQNGFYLIDETGTIAVLMDGAEMETLSIGDEVVLEGIRFTKCEGSGYYGQTLIKDATVVANYYGSNDYCDDTFVHGTTLADFYSLDVMTDYSTTVFVVNAIVDYVQTNFYTTIQLTDSNGTTVSLYCSGAGQYSWLKEFAGQEVTLELAACNWNGKNYWRGCVLSVILEDGSKVVNSLNFN